MHQPVENSSSIEERIVIMKLANCETVIGTVFNETNGFIEMMQPFRVMVTPTQTGNISLSLFKWDFTSDENYPVRLFKMSIVSCSKPNEMMLGYYRDAILSSENDEYEESEKTAEENLEEIEKKMMEILKEAKDSKLH